MSNWPNTVTIGGFVADNPDRVTVNLTGWDDAPAIRSGIQDRAQQDGGWDASGFYGPRIITVEGMVDQPSHAAAKAVADELLSLSPRTVHEFAVDNEAVGVRTAWVRVTQGAVLEWLNGEAFTYGLQVTAPDPLKYGPQVFGQATLATSGGGGGLTWPLTWPLDWGVVAGTTPGAVSVGNAGTASYFPRLRIDGPVPNPTVTLAETGDFIRYNGTVAAGQWLDIDLDRRRVLLNGQVSMRHLVTFGGAWLSVPPGGGTVSWTADAADPAATLSVWSYEGAWS